MKQSVAQFIRVLAVLLLGAGSIYLTLARSRRALERWADRQGYRLLRAERAWFVNADGALWPDAPREAYGHPGNGAFVETGQRSHCYLLVCPSLEAVAAVVMDAETMFEDVKPIETEKPNETEKPQLPAWLA